MMSCSSEKFLSEGQHVLTSVNVASSEKSIDAGSYRTYVRQEANSRWFNVVKVPLGIYCMAGTDSTKRFNRFLQRLGEAPVIYDEQMTQTSKNQLTLALQSRGYLHANVDERVIRPSCLITFIRVSYTVFAQLTM